MELVGWVNNDRFEENTSLKSIIVFKICELGYCGSATCSIVMLQSGPSQPQLITPLTAL